MQTAQALAAAHAQGLIHRDVKPANILLENGVERVRLTDFGLARAAEDVHLTETGYVPGTLMYMSPEQADGAEADQRSDLFSLGSVLYEMSTGRPPFCGATRLAVFHSVAEAAPRPVRKLNPEVPERLAAVIAKLHAKDPAKRYQTAAEVAAVLGELLAEAQHAGSAEPKQPALAEPTPSQWWPGWRRGLLLAAVGVLAAALSAALFLWPKKPPGESGNDSIDGGSKEAPPRKLIQPADLAKFKRVIDHDFTDAAKSPFLGERGKSPKVTPKWKMEHQWGRATVYVFHECPGANNRCLPDHHHLSPLTNVACRLVGRIKSGGRTAMHVWLGEPAPVSSLGVQVWNNGELTVEKTPWNKGDFSLPGQKPIRDEAILPGDQINELLVCLQDRQLRTYVNGKQIGQVVKLPEGFSPIDLGIGAWHIGPGEARVQVLRYELWDLDNPLGQRPPEPKKQPAVKSPADLAKLKPVVDHDFSDASKSPFKGERGPSPSVGRSSNSERRFGRETVYQFHAAGAPPRWRFDWNQLGPFTNAACRLTGRITSEDRVAMSLWLSGPTDGKHRALGVQVWNHRELTVEEPPWNKMAFPFSRPKPIHDEVIRPGDQTNELLVIIQDRQLRTFVNDKMIGQAVQLPKVLFPAHIWTGVWHTGDKEARVQFLRYTLWDLDNPR